MKIAVIHSIYKPYTRGGAEVVVENIVYGLKNKGYDVFVISVGRKNKVEEIDGIKVYRIKPFNIFNFLDINSKPAWLRLPWHIIDMFNDVQAGRVFKVLIKEKPDIILTHNLKGLGYYIPWLLRIMKIKQIHTVHDMQLIHPSGLLDDKRRENVLTKIFSWLAKKLFGSPSIVIFPSQYIKRVYEEHGFFKYSRRVIIQNPVVTVGYKPSAKSHKPLNLLFLGQVEEYKGILELIEAVRNLPVKLHVVGDGSALQKAKKIAGDNVIFYGRLSIEEVEEKIWLTSPKPSQGEGGPQIDVLINPSKTPESFGMVVIEAYAHGVPVLATRVGALPELIKNKKTGWLVELSGLKNKIKNIIITDEMKKNCLQEAKKYGIDNYLNKLGKFVKMSK